MIAKTFEYSVRENEFSYFSDILVFPNSEDKMSCEFARASLVDSQSMKEYVGFDFLLKFDDVRIYKV